MKHLLYETRQGNFGFLPAETLEMAKKIPEIYEKMIGNLQTVIFTKVGNISQEEYHDLIRDEEKVKETMKTGILDKVGMEEEDREQEIENEQYGGWWKRMEDRVGR